VTLAARFALARGRLALDVDLSATDDATLALVGPNGAGKTSCLRALAGLARVDAGSIVLDGVVLDGGPGGPFVPPPRRRVGLLAQEPLLFPHLSALDNVAYGPRARGVPRRAARQRAARWLARVGLADLADRRPAALSGGQAQRVALARAAATAPRLLLLDEPLSAVDASSRLALRRALREHLDAFEGARVVVAHDAVDAFALADRVAVLEDGRIVQTGTVEQICARPRSAYVADLVGVNLLRGSARGGEIHCEGGGRLVVGAAPDGPVLATVHPRAIALYPRRPEGSPRNVWRAPVLAVERVGDRARVRVGGVLPLVAEVTPAALTELRLHRGDETWVALKATEIAVDPA